MKQSDWSIEAMYILSMVMYGYQWLCTVMYGYVLLLCMVMYRFLWLCMVMYGYSMTWYGDQKSSHIWLYMVMYCYIIYT